MSRTPGDLAKVLQEELGGYLAAWQGASTSEEKQDLMGLIQDTRKRIHQLVLQQVTASTAPVGKYSLCVKELPLLDIVRLTVCFPLAPQTGKHDVHHTTEDSKGLTRFSINP